MRLVHQLSYSYSKIQSFYIHEYEQGIWQLKQVFHAQRQEELYAFLMEKKWVIDYAVLGLNGAFRNTFYVCCPSVVVMILPISLWEFCERLCAIMQKETYLEVAISQEEECTEIVLHERIYMFLHDFYQIKSKEDAVAYYEKWQLENTVSDKLVQHFVRTVEYFKEEIFNYFLLREIVP